MRELLRREQLEDLVEVESAGTGAWHVGNPPDSRATAAARARGIALEGAARKVQVRDFEDFDLILAMDRSNLQDLRRLAPDEEARAKVRLLREFDPAGDADSARGGGDLDVPDPYYGGANGFEEVLDFIQAACAGLLAEICGARDAAETRGALGVTGIRGVRGATTDFGPSPASPT